MPNMGGLELLERITDLQIPVLTVIMTGFGTVETAIEAMKKGAYDYILKPFKVEEVVHIVQRGLDRQRLQPRTCACKEALSHLQDQRGDRDLAVASRRCWTWCWTRPWTRSTPTSSACCWRIPTPPARRRASRAASSSRCARCRRAPTRTSRRRR